MSFFWCSLKWKLCPKAKREETMRGREGIDMWEKKESLLFSYGVQWSAQYGMPCALSAINFNFWWCLSTANITVFSDYNTRYRQNPKSFLAQHKREQSIIFCAIGFCFERQTNFAFEGNRHNIYDRNILYTNPVMPSNRCHI